MAITTEDDPTPLVLILANTVRRSVAAQPSIVAKLKGVAAVCSLHDPQAVTLRFDKGDVHLTHGRSPDAKVVITIDLALDGLPDAPAPKVTGALTHLRFALGLGKVLDPPLPGWRTAAEEFWSASADRAFMPTGLRITETGSGAVHEVGATDGDVSEVIGPEDRLTRIFTGTAFALEEVAEGRCHVRGSLAAAAAITHAGIALGLADEAAR